MFMDDIKIYGKNTKDLDFLVQTFRVITEDMRMEFDINKFTAISISRRKVIQTEGIKIPDNKIPTNTWGS